MICRRTTSLYIRSQRSTLIGGSLVLAHFHFFVLPGACASVLPTPVLPTLRRGVINFASRVDRMIPGHHLRSCCTKTPPGKTTPLWTTSVTGNENDDCPAESSRPRRSTIKAGESGPPGKKNHAKGDLLRQPYCQNVLPVSYVGTSLEDTGGQAKLLKDADDLTHEGLFEWGGLFGNLLPSAGRLKETKNYCELNYHAKNGAVYSARGQSLNSVLHAWSSPASAAYSPPRFFLRGHSSKTSGHIVGRNPIARHANNTAVRGDGQARSYRAMNQLRAAGETRTHAGVQDETGGKAREEPLSTQNFRDQFWEEFRRMDEKVKKRSSGNCKTRPKTTNLIKTGAHNGNASGSKQASLVRNRPSEESSQFFTDMPICYMSTREEVGSPRKYSRRGPRDEHDVLVFRGTNPTGIAMTTLDVRKGQYPRSRNGTVVAV